MKFTKKVMLTGKEVREKKDGSPYFLLHLLMDNGQTCTLMYRDNLEGFNALKPMEKYTFDFEFVVSKYGQRLDVLGVVNEQGK